MLLREKLVWEVANNQWEMDHMVLGNCSSQFISEEQRSILLN